jgi:hypothetical protein
MLCIAAAQLPVVVQVRANLASACGVEESVLQRVCSSLRAAQEQQERHSGGVCDYHVPAAPDVEVVSKKRRIASWIDSRFLRTFDGSAGVRLCVADTPNHPHTHTHARTPGAGRACVGPGRRAAEAAIGDKEPHCRVLRSGESHRVAYPRMSGVRERVEGRRVGGCRVDRVVREDEMTTPR